MGWMSNWLYANVEPTAPWRGVQSVPRALSLARRPEGIRLVQTPVAELQALRATSEPALLTAPAALPPSAEIELEVKRTAAGEAGLRLFNAAGEEVVIGVAAQGPEVFVDRRRSRRTAFHEAYPGRHAGPVRWKDDRVRLRILFDRSTLEVFASDGETVVSERVYPTRPLERIEALRTGAGALGPVRVWTLRSIWP
jgi:sucrose-6-phosphate hydrolase SacC (GH32 family)